MSTHSRFQKFFADQFQDSWLSFEGFEDYFTNVICSLTSDKFTREKDKWVEEEQRLLDDQKTLAFKHYQSFVSVAECSNDIRRSFDGLEGRMESVIETVPGLQEAIADCSKVALDTNRLRKEANISIQKHPQLLEILELPQLIDTSIRNNYYEEGLELHGFVSNMAVKYADIPIIQMIKEDSDTCIRHMEEVLLKQLQGPISLAQCLKSVGLLRRIGSYNDTQLKVKFLQVRTEWFRGVIDNINNSEVQYYMCKMIDSYRINLFDIITQYRSVFIEDKATSLIFNSWLHAQVHHFIGLINSNLPRCNGAVIDSTLAQAMYFGMSLGRIGSDFRGALVPIFQQRILQLSLQNIKTATERFKKNSNKLSNIPFNGEPTLVTLAPLALYTNTIITMFNELRHCAPTGVSQALVGRLEESLRRVLEITTGIVRDMDKARAEQITKVIVLEMMPLIDNTIKAVFTTIPDICKNRSSSSSNKSGGYKAALSLKSLQEPLLPYLSTATKILLNEDTHLDMLDNEDEDMEDGSNVEEGKMEDGSNVEEGKMEDGSNVEEDNLEFTERCNQGIIDRGHRIAQLLSDQDDATQAIVPDLHLNEGQLTYEHNQELSLSVSDHSPSGRNSDVVLDDVLDDMVEEPSRGPHVQDIETDRDHVSH